MNEFLLDIIDRLSTQKNKADRRQSPAKQSVCATNGSGQAVVAYFSDIRIALLRS